ncbi:small multidrug efflux protein [Microbacterium sp. WCS2018Hpa-23]|uniref:small multidrug efflux protein n=1 Tax=Microbacterium sp. WCS2018Hpa-23 TaxID=3073634 RepID=UPI0028830CD7|nr:small multidrug efflux protein [Microbacterium sp. WCS2018Hpa-23]
MNLIETFQGFVAQVPELVQPLIVALAGAIPFIEGEGAVSIGIIGGIHPVVAAIAAMVGNFLCVAVLVIASSGARTAIVNRNRSREAVLAGTSGAAVESAPAESERGGARKEKFQRAFERYGVPGVSLLGPLLLPTQFTATMLAAAGVGKVRILIWQAVAIIGWTTIVAVIVGSAVYAIR